MVSASIFVIVTLLVSSVKFVVSVTVDVSGYSNDPNTLCFVGLLDLYLYALLIEPVAVTFTEILRLPTSTLSTGILILKLSDCPKDEDEALVLAFTTSVPLGALLKDTV